MKQYSNITFFYYDNYDEAVDFYENIFHLEVVQDQGGCKLYRQGKTFFGIVDSAHGTLKAQPKNACMLTIIVDDVMEWYEYLTSKGVKVYSGPNHTPFVDNVFYIDPGGYIVETQKFLDEKVQKEFE